MATVNNPRELFLDDSLDIDISSLVKDILLVSDKNEFHEDDTSVEEIKASLIGALQRVKEGKTRSISELWRKIDD
ncbi:hypothetical protein GM3708_248 [Geminocystis sp. NIES-3708]|uniref:type II toxin-antitoxin system RelN family antitoxin n=1 Tax=Geminocystis sp. NIES-3708 TaxID=1615909 RepID=UPI0005FC3980|nr:hypothetical protein [Geminocystis sp. NIES-3708]BAQ59842.1 hypothetical protein GM3708_248 [Geminocystis sp. NIES-3708]